MPNPAFLPSSTTEIIFSEQLVITRSNVLPLTWVGKWTSCSMFSSVTVSRSRLPREDAVPSSQFISGKFTSPISTVFLPALCRMLQSCSVVLCPAPGGLYTNTMCSGSPFVWTVKLQNCLNSLFLNLSDGKILNP